MRVPPLLSTALGCGWLLLLISAFAAAEEDAASQQNDPQAVEFFEKHIRPVLIKHCYECHSADAKTIRGGLLLDTRGSTRKGGDSGPAVTPGKPEESLLLSALRYEGYEMPPSGKLPETVIRNFEKWIKLGAADPRSGEAVEVQKSIDWATARKFWAFQPPRPVKVHQVQNMQWPESSIDHFILARLEEHNLQPVADARPHVLLRRLYFDLIGLPPTPQQIDTFAEDASPQALENTVDRLLASPHFGQRWGRHWLDLARFAESNGSDRNVIWPHAWRYRDYVIDAFNADKPYDEFLREQIAGDLLPHASSQQRDEQLVATGLLTLTPKIFMEPNGDRFRMDVVDEQIDVVSRAVLGLTVSCARCHDHKFDPIPQTDYYALAGIFESTQTLYGTGAPAGNQYGHDRPLQPIGPQSEKLHGPYQAHGEQVAEKIKVRNKARSDRYRVVRKVQSLKAEKERQQKALADKPEELAQEVQRIDAEIAPLEKEIAQWDEKIKQHDAELKQLEDNPPPAPDYCMAAADVEKPADARLRIRGEFNRQGDSVPRGFLTIAAGEPARIPEKQSGRLQLADWLTSEHNPLTARVMVNRVWRHLFGEGLVRSVNNFGAAGERPSHPQLLDYLAWEFKADGWSLKRLIRRLVLSRVYRLSSDHHAGNYAVDADNRWLWRANYRRLEVEPLRDAILTVSGRLDLARPETSVMSSFDEVELNDRVKLSREQLEQNHRAVYLPVARISLPEMFEEFDFADPSIVIGRRTERTMPAQSLYLMNSPWVIEQAGHAARRLLADEPSDAQARVQLLYRRCLARRPEAEETQQVLRFVKEFAQSLPPAEVENSAQKDSASPELEAWSVVCQLMLASAEFRYLD